MVVAYYDAVTFRKCVMQNRLSRLLAAIALLFLSQANSAKALSEQQHDALVAVTAGTRANALSILPEDAPEGYADKVDVQPGRGHGIDCRPSAHGSRGKKPSQRR